MDEGLITYFKDNSGLFTIYKDGKWICSFNDAEKREVVKYFKFYRNGGAGEPDYVRMNHNTIANALASKHGGIKYNVSRYD